MFLTVCGSYLKELYKIVLLCTLAILFICFQSTNVVRLNYVIMIRTKLVFRLINQFSEYKI